MIEKEGEDRMGNRCLAVWQMFCGRRRRNLRKIVTKNYPYLLLLLWLHIPIFFLKLFFPVQQICRCTSVGLRYFGRAGVFPRRLKGNVEKMECYTTGRQVGSVKRSRWPRRQWASDRELSNLERLLGDRSDPAKT